MGIGEKIKDARKRKKLTQRELAERLGLATGTIQQYELNKREPKQEQVKRIAEALDIPWQSLYFEDDEQYDEFVRLDYGTKIRRLRENKGWTQDDLAEALNISRSAVADYENSVTEPSSDMFKEIARALDVGDWSQIATGRAIVEHVIAGTEKAGEPRKLNLSEMQKIGALTFRSDDHRISFFYNRLNDEGKRVAADRVQELTEIPRYQRKREPGKEDAPDEP